MIPWYLVRHYVGEHSKFTAACGALLVSTVLFYNFFHVFLIVWAFIGGMTLTYTCLSPNALLPNLLPMYARNSKKSSEDDELTLMKTLCTVCGLKKCPRHRPELNILAFQPWTNLNLPQTVDQALDEFFNIVLKDFVYTWYRDLSEDEEFVDELRCNFRFLASVFLRRIKKVDLPQLVSERILPAAMQHIDICVQAYKQAGNQGDLQSVCLDHVGPRVHCAMWSRKAELEYIRRLVESLFPYILRPQALNSRSTCALVRELLAGSVLLPTMDALADPDILNNLLLVFFDKTPPPEATEPPSPLVPFLGQFSQARAHNQSCLRIDLQDAIKPESTDLLYPFMQFLKSEAAVNVLQFCLACEDFNKRILSPDVSQSEFVELHQTAKDLYNSYCAPTALDRIMFDQEIIDQLREVVESPPYQVIKLRTSTPLFKAYEHAYNLLENNFLPLFHQSDDYYNMICGGRPNASLSKQIPSIFGGKAGCLRANRKKDFTLAQFGSKLKDVFKSNDERSMSDSDTNLNLLSANSMTASMDINDLDSEEMTFADDASMHDLSTWRVTIPRIGARPDPENPRKQFYVFIVDVRRVDIGEGDAEKSQWTVARRYKEFYVLAQKLTEFHGEFPDCVLPSKRSFGTKSHDFTESKIAPFETYLKTLLEKPQLKSSELLYNFLTSENEFSTSFLPDIKLGKFVKSKLVKERGQHLDPFLVGFSQSTEAAKPKPSKVRRGSDASCLSTSSEKLMSSSLFENNVNSGFEAPPPACNGGDNDKAGPTTRCPRVMGVEGPFDSMVFVAREVYGCPQWLAHLLHSGRILLKQTVDAFLHHYIHVKTRQVTQEHRLVALVHLLRDVLFFDTDPPRTDEDKLERYRRVVEEFDVFLPDVLSQLIGRSKVTQGSHLLLQIFQQPKLNKQLSYVFLDVVIQELFPEISLPAADNSSGKNS